MPKLVVSGATLACSMGSSPAKLSVLPTNETYGGSNPAATVQDMKPQVNLAPFGMCQSPINPQVAAATAAASGRAHSPAVRSRCRGPVDAGLEERGHHRRRSRGAVGRMQVRLPVGRNHPGPGRGADGDRGRLSMVLAEGWRMFPMRKRDALRLVVLPAIRRGCPCSDGSHLRAVVKGASVPSNPKTDLSLVRFTPSLRGASRHPMTHDVPTGAREIDDKSWATPARDARPTRFQGSRAHD